MAQATRVRSKRPPPSAEATTGPTSSHPTETWFKYRGGGLRPNPVCNAWACMSEVSFVAEIHSCLAPELDSLKDSSPESWGGCLGRLSLAVIINRSWRPALFA